LNNTRILIVEDKAIVAHNVEDRLKASGYEVPAIAFSGEEVIQLVADTRPDLVLMDIRLPGEMDGVEAVHKVRDQYDIPIVFLTGHADDATITPTRSQAGEIVNYVGTLRDATREVEQEEQPVERSRG
jgi:CheY-like chemotaxis protein